MTTREAVEKFREALHAMVQDIGQRASKLEQDTWREE